MTNFIILLLVSIIVSQDVEVLKVIKDYFLNKEWKQGKFAVPFAVAVGVVAGVLLNIGITDSLIRFFQIDFILPTKFMYFDIASSCLLLTRGSGALIDVLEKFKEVRGITPDKSDITK